MTQPGLPGTKDQARVQQNEGHQMGLEDPPRLKLRLPHSLPHPVSNSLVKSGAN